MNSLNKGFVNGFLWSLTGKIGYLFILLFTNIVLARLLSPYEFGQVGIVMFFIIISNVLSESGLSGAIIQKKDISDNDYSTVFIFNLGVSLLLFALLVSCSGFIADFYNNQQLQNILIALSFILIINAFKFTQNAKIVRNLNFKKQSVYSIISILFSSIIGVILAFLEFGVWALVIMQLSNAFLLTLIYWIFEGAIKSFFFSKSSFKQLYKFGVNTTLASILDTIFDNIYQLILGKYFSINQSGLYYQAKKLQDIPIGVIRSSTLGVVFATLSRLQENKTEFDEFYNRIIKIFTVIVGLICILIYFYAEQIILILYGPKWLAAVYFIKILVIASFFYMQEMFNRILFKVLNRTDKILQLEIFKKLIQSVTIIIGVIYLNIEILIYGILFTSIISYFSNYYYSRIVYKNFSLNELLIVIKIILISYLSVVIAEYLSEFFRGGIYNNIILSPFIIGFYFIMSKLFKVVNILSESKHLINQLKYNK